MMSDTAMSMPAKWRPLISAYSAEEKLGMRFRSIKEFERAIDVRYDDPALQLMPFFTPDGYMLIVPKEAVPLFKEHGLRFSVERIYSAADFPPEEVAEMRRRHGL